MEREQLIEKLERADDEQRAELLSWLNDGAGHTVAELDYYVSKGIPIEFVEPMMRRSWSNFVQVPRGITKVALDCVTERPIGYYESEDEYKSGWKFLLLPQEQENGFLSDGYRSIADSRVKRIFVEDVGEYDYEYPEEVWDDYIKTHRLHPKAQYWSSHWELCGNWSDGKGTLTIEYRLPVCPDVDKYDDNKPREHVLNEKHGHHLIKYVGTKRVDYINTCRVMWHAYHAKQKPMTKKAAMEKVKETLEKSPTIAWSGNVDYQKGDKRRPLKDIAQDIWQESQDELAYHIRSIDRYTERCPDIWDYIKGIQEYPVWDLTEVPTPTGWVYEKFEPMGYMDVMWNHNWLVPWVDGIGSHSVINAIKRTLGDENFSYSSGRGSGARQDAEYLLTYMKENNIVFGDEEE